MRNLEMPQGDPLELYDSVVTSREKPRGPLLAGLRGRIVCSYLRYYCHRAAPERLRPLGRRVAREEAAALRYCYGVARSGNGVLARLLAATYFCAYCGIHPATTLDHYLPKDGKGGFPEYSLLPVNLVPACSRCNTPRGLRDADTGQRALIHPYFDEVGSARLLVAEVRMESGEWEVDFRVDVHGCSDHAFGQIYARHARLLDLLTRYRTLAMLPDAGLADIERAVRVWSRGRSSAELRASLLEAADDHERRLGANHFKAALYRGAAASPSFIDHCSRGPG